MLIVKSNELSTMNIISRIVYQRTTDALPVKGHTNNSIEVTLYTFYFNLNSTHVRRSV